MKDGKDLVFDTVCDSQRVLDMLRSPEIKGRAWSQYCSVRNTESVARNSSPNLLEDGIDGNRGVRVHGLMAFPSERATLCAEKKMKRDFFDTGQRLITFHFWDIVMILVISSSYVLYKVI